jgi:hypothetical protein
MAEPRSSVMSLSPPFRAWFPGSLNIQDRARPPPLPESVRVGRYAARCGRRTITAVPAVEARTCRPRPHDHVEARPRPRALSAMGYSGRAEKRKPTRESKMADNLQKRGPADRSRVNVNEPWEIEWWSKKWSISPETLRATVKRVGVMAKDVAKHLNKPVP